jgi:S1-C subfamily serine protease
MYGILMESGVVHLKVSGSTPNYLQPWISGDRWFSFGTGFVIEYMKEILVVTNAHVVENGKKFSMNTSTGKDIPLTLIQYLPEIDISFLKPSEKLNTEILTLAEKMPPKGSQLKILGFPLGGKNISTHVGTFNRVIWVTYMDIATGLCMQTDTAMNPGVSGGPALNMQNEVVGVCVSGLRNFQNFNHLIPVALVRWGLSLLHKPITIGRFPFEYTATQNSMLRKILQAPEDLGIMVTESSDKSIKIGDIITHVDGHKIQQDATMKVSDILESEQDNDTAFARYYPSLKPPKTPVAFTVFRNGKSQEIKSKVIALNRPTGILPPVRCYYALAGWVFAPWNRFSQAQHEKAGHGIPNMHINDVYILEEWDTEFTEQIGAKFSRIIDVNGKNIENFEHFVNLIEPVYKKAKGLLSIGYVNTYETGRIILNMSDVVEAQDQIMADHASSADRFLLPKQAMGGNVAPPALLDPELS